MTGVRVAVPGTKVKALHDAALFAPEYDARDRLVMYGAFGGVPGNLALVAPGVSVAQNIERHMLDSTSRLYDEAERVLDPFLSDAQVHYSVLHAVASGEQTWRGITKTVGKSSGSLSRPIRWLVDMGYLRREVPVTEPDAERSKRALYRVDDPYLNFWHRFVGPLVRRGTPATLTPHLAWERHVRPHLDDYMGAVFQSACRQFIGRSYNAAFVPDSVGRWWNHNATEEVDVVAVAPGELLVGECKWGRPTSADLATLKRRARLVAAELGNEARLHLALFTASDVADHDVLAAVAAGDIALCAADDLF